MSATASSFWTFYDLHPSGERFIIIERGSGQEALRGVVVVLNWLEQLKRLVPTDR